MGEEGWCGELRRGEAGAPLEGMSRGDRRVELAIEGRESDKDLIKVPNRA